MKMLSEKDLLPWHPLCTHPLSPLLSHIPNILSYSVFFSVYWLRHTILHVVHVIHGWLEALQSLEMNNIEYWLI